MVEAERIAGREGLVVKLFYAALEIKSGDERSECRERACARNVELRAAVDDLLVTQAKAEKFFSGSAVQQVSVSDIAKTLAEMPDFGDRAGLTPPPDEELG